MEAQTQLGLNAAGENTRLGFDGLRPMIAGASVSASLGATIVTLFVNYTRLRKQQTLSLRTCHHRFGSRDYVFLQTIYLDSLSWKNNSTDQGCPGAHVRRAPSVSPKSWVSEIFPSFKMSLVVPVVWNVNNLVKISAHTSHRVLWEYNETVEILLLRRAKSGSDNAWILAQNLNTEHALGTSESTWNLSSGGRLVVNAIT